MRTARQPSDQPSEEGPRPGGGPSHTRPTTTDPRTKVTEKTTSEPSREDLDGIDPRVYARRWKILGALCVSLLTVMLANGSLTLALPGMSADLGLTTLQQTWVLDLYSLIFAALLFTCGAVGDRYGRKGVMQLGLVIFTVVNIYAAAVADSGAELIAMRGLMGIGAALVMPTTLSLINNVFPRRERARAIAVWTGVAGGGAGLGSVFSGVLLEQFDWRSVFLVSAVLSFASWLANQLLAPESRDEKRTPIDWWGGVLSTLGILGLVYAIIEGPSEGWTDQKILGGIALAVVGLGLFILWQLRVRHPMLDLKLFRNPVFSISTVACTIAFFALIGSMFALAQLFQLILGYGELKSALLTLPMMVPMMFLAPLVPTLVRTWGPRWTMTTGLGVMSVGFLISSQWDANVGYWSVLLPMIVIALGMGLMMPPATDLLMSSVPRNRSGMGSAMNDTARELGGTIGIGVLGSLLSSGYAAGIAGAVVGLPDKLKDVAESSLAGALHGVFPVLRENAGEQAAGHFLSGAQQAWMDGLSNALLVAAGISVLAALITAFGMPGKAKLGRYTGPTAHGEASDDGSAPTGAESPGPADETANGADDAAPEPAGSRH